MRISDWSSDVCSSDLLADSALHVRRIGRIGMGMFCAPTILDARERHDLAKVRQLPRLVFTTARSPGDWLVGDSTGGTQVIDRSEERRVGQEWVSTCRSRVGP